jgi:hypothetical protein
MTAALQPTLFHFPIPQKPKTYQHELIVDLFSGGGGASSGIEAALGRPVDHAVNQHGSNLEEFPASLRVREFPG